MAYPITGLTRISEILECEHPRLSEPRARTVSGGGVQFRRQCLECGIPVGNAVSRADAYERNGGCAPAPFDEALLEAKRQTAQATADREYEVRSAAWWSWYNDYLKSPEWLERRRLVLERENHRCEGCRQQRAVHVHHLTYDHVGNELLYELRALCEDCHDLAHDETERLADRYARGR